ncbi:hypothetical protein DYB38_009853, partial [Aphanomyces astaci]
MRVKVSELLPEWDDISHPAFKHSNYFAKGCRRVAASFDTRRQANDAAASDDDTVSGSEPNGVDTFDATETVEQGGPPGEDTETMNCRHLTQPSTERMEPPKRRHAAPSEKAFLPCTLRPSSHTKAYQRATSVCCWLLKVTPSAASNEDSYDSDFEDYFKMTSVPVKFPKALGGKHSGKTPRTKCRPRDHTIPRDITPAPAPPSPAYPKDPATRRAATPLSAAPTHATRQGSNEASATRASTNPKDPANIHQTRGDGPPTKIKPTKAPRNLNEAPNVIVLTESDDSEDDVKFESVEADPDALGRIYTHTKIIEYVGEYMSMMDFLRLKRLKQ